MWLLLLLPQQKAIGNFSDGFGDQKGGWKGDALDLKIQRENQDVKIKSLQLTQYTIFVLLTKQIVESNKPNSCNLKFWFNFKLN